MDIFVSIVVPVYNCENTIKMCMDSLLEIEYPKDKYEIIAVDNNSSDSSLDILKSYNNKIKVFSESKKGPSAARNAGIKQSTGEIIVFTDSDCVVDKYWLKNIVIPFLEPKSESIGVVAGKIKTLNSHSSIALSGDLIHDHKKAVSYDVPYAISMNWASRKNVLSKVGYFDEDFIRSQDSELALRIYRNGYRLVYVENAVIYHRNPDNFRELYNKGYLSGLYGVKTYHKHKDFIDSIDKKSSDKKFIAIFRSIISGYLKEEKLITYICLVVYHFGRFSGMLLSKFKHN